MGLLKLSSQLKIVHFFAITFFAPYLYQLSAGVQIMHFFGAIWDKSVNLAL